MSLRVDAHERSKMTRLTSAYSPRSVAAPKMACRVHPGEQFEYAAHVPGTGQRAFAVVAMGGKEHFAGILFSIKAYCRTLPPPARNCDQLRSSTRGSGFA